jgi:sugar/nucleoside kinase (ribokinase family)
MDLDVYVYGIVSASTVYLLREDFGFPKANGYGEIARTLPSIGGEAANSAIVLARLGLRTRLDGNWLGALDAERVKNTLAGYGIDVSRLTTTDDGGTHEFVVADGDSRTVFGNYVAFGTGSQQWNEPLEEDIAAASIVCLDPYLGESSLRAAEYCVAHSTPYVTLDVPFDGYIAQHAAAISVSHELRDQSYAGQDMRLIFQRFIDSCPGLIVFTFGGDELWYGRQGGGMTIWQPYQIEPVDSSGAGDSFRGALAFGLRQGWPNKRVVEFAAAVAACVCLNCPHTLNAPTFDEVGDFIREHTRA